MPGGGAQKPAINPWFVAVAVMIATFMEVMDTSIASVAVPYIAGSTASTNDQAEWVLTVYLVANAVFLPASGWLSEKFGRKNYLIASVGLFTAASFLCGIAPTLPFILVARALQGIGGGALQPLAQAILIESFPPQKQGQALGLYALGVVVAPVIGPALGGYLTDAVSWRWAFYINVPIGLLAMFLQSRALEDPPYIKNAKPGKLDGIGLGTLGLWVGCLQYILDKGQEDDWFGDTKIRIAFGVMIVTFILFVIREFTTEKPLVNLRSLRDRNLGLSCLLIFMLGIVLYAITTVLPVFYQTLLGYSATKSGLVVSPRGLGAMVSAILVGAVVAKIDPRWFVALGFAMLGASGMWLAGFTLDISFWSLFLPILVSGAAISMCFVPLGQLALGTLPKNEVGNGSGIFNFLRNVGGSVGISWMNTIAQRHQQTYRFSLLHSFTPANPLFQRELNAYTQMMAQHVGPRLAMLRAYGLIDRGLNNQAQIAAYVDDFRYLAFVAFCCAPLAFLLKRPKPGAAQAAG
ncbi:DHA2 family efflux MFS transporter permease subunit [Terriglobus sp.]|uniref:DHA2 family efflux MFS transporter permease subunit n=1 Tax=Terriglobus sp. TaxID=1889013 RepID=UPI003AFFA686